MGPAAVMAGPTKDNDTMRPPLVASQDTPVHPPPSRHGNVDVFVHPPPAKGLPAVDVRVSRNDSSTFASVSTYKACDTERDAEAERDTDCDGDAEEERDGDADVENEGEEDADRERESVRTAELECDVDCECENDPV